MDSGTFNGLLAQLAKEPFSKDKIAVLNSYRHCVYSGAQLAKVLEQFPHSSDKDTVVQTVAPQLTTLSGQDAKQLVQGISFSSDQVKVIKLIASHIDPATKYMVLDAIAFSNDRAEARQYLDAAVFMPGPCGAYPQQPPPQQFGQFPGGCPPTQPGGFPSPAGYPGSYPPPQAGPYPGGVYPPQQPGGYPPQQQPAGFPGVYPPQQPGVAFPGAYPPQQPYPFPQGGFQQGGFPPGYPPPSGAPFGNPW